VTGAPREPAPLTAEQEAHIKSTIAGFWLGDTDDRYQDGLLYHDLLPAVLATLDATRSQLEQAQRECAEAREGHVATLAEFHAARAEAEKLREAIAWVLGERGAFPGRIYTEGPYWWRTELRRRAALSTPPAGEKP
jgi:hypothetical protein